MELLFLDTETGGLNPSSQSLLQVGLVAYCDGKIKDKKFISIKEEEYYITAEAMMYNGLDLYNDVYKNGLRTEEAVEEIIKFIQISFKSKPILVGHNVALDKYFLKKLFETEYEDMDEYISYRMIDTMSLIWGLHMVGKLPIEACSSSGAFDYFNIDVKGRHTAIGDCLGTVELYEKLLEQLR